MAADNKTVFRSADWFNNPAKIDETGFHIERVLAQGWTLDELQSGKPIIGIAQTGSDIAPCNRHHIELAKRVREGIREAGGIAFEFPSHPIQETLKRPTAALDRNLQYLSLVKVLSGYPLDGVVLTTECDKTTPAQLMAAATVGLPAIVLSGGPMLSGWHNGRRIGSGTIVWKAQEMLARGEIDNRGALELIASSAPSSGHCNTMGTATTMNALAEALDMSLPGSAVIPAPYAGRAQVAYLTGKRIVELVLEDLRPTQILTRKAFENAIVINSAIGELTNAQSISRPSPVMKGSSSTTTIGRVDREHDVVIADGLNGEVKHLGIVDAARRKNKVPPEILAGREFQPWHHRKFSGEPLCKRMPIVDAAQPVRDTLAQVAEDDPQLGVPV